MEEKIKLSSYYLKARNRLELPLAPLCKKGGSAWSKVQGARSETTEAILNPAISENKLTPYPCQLTPHLRLLRSPAMQRPAGAAHLTRLNFLF